MGSKSTLLALVRGSLSMSSVPDFIRVARCEWLSDPAAVVERCARLSGGASVAVRSDADVEDSPTESHAGKFLSLLDVDVGGVGAAIDRVFASMPAGPAQGVVVQGMVRGSLAVCVGSTHRIADGAGWYCLDVAPSSGPVVTGGRALVHQSAVTREHLDEVLGTNQLGDVDRAFLEATVEVESLVGIGPVETEMAISRRATGALSVHMLQVRPISTVHAWTGRSGPGHLPPLDFLSRPDEVDGIAGAGTVLSLMADWNPTELLGKHPRPLALSLFRHLVTSATWWQARAALGYRHTPPGGNCELLRVLAGRPFVDVRRSANSLLPAGLQPHVASALVDAWMERLRRCPARHDKVEFDVFQTIRDFREWPPCLRDEYALSRTDFDDWHDALMVLGRHVVAAGSSSPLGCLQAESESLAGSFDPRADWEHQLRKAAEVAALFAGVARLAFIGEAMLRSAVERNAMTGDRALALREAATAGLLQGPDGSTDDAGHLRPGTFEITSLAWNEARDQVERTTTSSRGPVPLNPAEVRRISRLLDEAGYTIGSREWLAFVVEALRARERVKFIFSRFLSSALDKLVVRFERAGLDRETASWLTLDELAGTDRPDDWLVSVSRSKERHEAQSRILTSAVLTGDGDRFVATNSGVLPNFIGRDAVEARIVPLKDADAATGIDVSRSIVVTERADPGYDWMFAQGIAGLITAWGGANSHLAIRCAEFSLPAAIGCGEALVARAMRSSHARIDPLSGGVWLS